MRPLKSRFPVHALTPLDTILKQTQEARVFRRAQAVHAVVAGHHISTVSAPFHLANAALRQWVQRLAQEGPPGLAGSRAPGAPPNHMRAGAAPQSPRRRSPPGARLPLVPVEVS
jgi:hypothetical protein